jgi:hypothetical protein
MPGPPPPRDCHAKAGELEHESVAIPNKKIRDKVDFIGANSTSEDVLDVMNQFNRELDKTILEYEPIR